MARRQEGEQDFTSKNPALLFFFFKFSHLLIMDQLLDYGQCFLISKMQPGLLKVC